MIDTNIFLVLGLILVSTKIFSIFVRRINLPQVLGALVAGILLGPSVLNLAGPNEVISTFAEIGVILLLFSAGMETDFRQLRKNFKASMLIALLGAAAAVGGGFAVAHIFGYPLFECLFVGVMIASTSVSITVEALNEMGKLNTKSGSAIMGAALFDDVLAIIFLAVVIGMGEEGFSAISVGVTLIKIVVFFGVAFLIGMLVKRLFNFLITRYGRTRRLPVFAAAYCFLLAYLAEFVGLAGLTGAYLAGIAFCSTRCAEYLEEKTHILSYMLFTPIFLANIGLHTSFEGLDGKAVLFAALLVVAAIAGKLFGCGLGAKLCGYSGRESAQVGAGMIAQGEVALVIASKGIAAGVVGAQIFPSVIVVVLVTVLLAPLLIKLTFKHRRAVKES